MERPERIYPCFNTILTESGALFCAGKSGRVRPTSKAPSETAFERLYQLIGNTESISGRNGDIPTLIAERKDLIAVYQMRTEFGSNRHHRTSHLQGGKTNASNHPGVEGLFIGQNGSPLPGPAPLAEVFGEGFLPPLVTAMIYDCDSNAEQHSQHPFNENTRPVSDSGGNGEHLFQTFPTSDSFVGSGTNDYFGDFEPHSGSNTTELMMRDADGFCKDLPWMSALSEKSTGGDVFGDPKSVGPGIHDS
ncbi:hypothetical protein M231_02785 [Tremella mesenterica]|uniref:Uncharacterized protein n=1 Tax=Tremella mesenterica TaxID=5217 RepID=A0A4Q1BQ58_TREME|nr:hypothetical protein M231_02785 [Tremella mesenterica]